MKIPTTFKHSLKSVRYQGRRWAAGLRYGPGALEKLPAVLGNAMPKSGSHLIIQVLQGLTRIGPFVNPGYPPVNRSEDNRKLSDCEVLAKIQRMLPGEISYGYISAKEPFLSALTLPGRATIFVYRDPRDMIVSHIFYATQMHTGHWVHSDYTEELANGEERTQAAIHGVQEPGSELTPIRQRYDGYLGWLEQPQVLCLRFEELILERETAFGKLLDYLAAFGFTPSLSRSEAIVILHEAIAPRRSGTFRKGKPGNWREHFTPTNISAFKEATGDLLLRLGYETNQDW